MALRAHNLFDFLVRPMPPNNLNKKQRAGIVFGSGVDSNAVATSDASVHRSEACWNHFLWTENETCTVQILDT